MKDLPSPQNGFKSTFMKAVSIATAGISTTSSNTALSPRLRAGFSQLVHTDTVNHHSEGFRPHRQGWGERRRGNVGRTVAFGT